MTLLEALQDTQLGSFFITLVVAMLPVLELRAAIPIGVSMGLGPWQALLAAIIGNMIPVPFLILFIRRVFAWLRRHFPKIEGTLSRLENKAHLKGRKVSKYKYLGLLILVAIPLPGTGAWTGALVADVLDIRMRTALPAIAAGVVIAGCITTAVTCGVAWVL